jgi:tRNA A-37 threonylcarbamoyl transferase component Bud32
LIAPAERKPDLAKYEIKEEIGHGGMAVVYLARDRRLGRDVAVKLIHRHLRENAEVAARFVSEARAVAKLKHPNIVEVYDVSDPEEEERYLICELVRGTTLRKILSDHRQLPAEIAACVGVEIADALDHAHGLGVIHRDVKPENVLVAQPNLASSSDGTKTSAPDAPLVKITDFGIAKLLDAQGVTSTGQVLGSPAHMAPEQIEGGDVNARSDVFGLGVLLYEAMVGRLPFDGKNPAQVLRRVLDGAFTPPDKARPTIGSRFSAIVGRALAHDPAGRYASAAELSAALKDELVALGFHDVRGELRAFLSAPEAFRENYEARVVDELVRRAAEARKHRDIPLSAACLNRALAFRPDDADLLAEVSSLGRAQRLRRNIVSAAIALGGSALIAAAGFAAVTYGGSLATRVKGAPSAGPVAPVAKQPAAVPPALESASPGDRIAKLLRPTPKRPKAPPRPVVGDDPGRALVKIVVDGPQNAIVRLDGVELKDWFGPPREITVGPHTFEFDPQSPECCEPGQRLTVNIKLPVAGEVQTVKGRIPFKDAVLELTGAPGSSASCQELGTFPVPSRQSIPMSTPQKKVRCTILAPPGSPVPPKEFDGTLSPGRVFRNPGT